MDLPDRAEKRWREKLASTKLTQPVVVDSCLIVGGVDNHTVYALDADSGEKRWNFVAGGRIDSAPTIYKGQVIFGSADGWVYSLDMGSGQLVWRFRAAPNAMQVGVESQLESAWPVHGSVLVHNDTLYATAGRNSYLDGGIVLYRLDPTTGKELSHKIVYDLDPETGKQLHSGKGQRFN